jgi:homoserine/homoserine lactone efflux protein
MTPETLAAFALLWTLAAAAPGPNVAFTVATGLATPLPRAFLAAAGIALGGLVYAALAAAGLGTLLLASAEAFAAVKWLGVAYLAWLALRAWREAGRAPSVPRAGLAPAAGTGLLLRAAAVMLANPKAALAYAAIFPAFVAPKAAALPQLALLSMTAAVCSFAVHCAYIALAGRLGSVPVLRRHPALAGRITAAMYAVAACALAAVRRGAT